jgi:hypothetical protein
MAYAFNKFHDDEGVDTSIIVKVDTKANILALTATAGLIAYATDVNRFYYANGTSWYEAPIALKARSANPNMGIDQDNPLSGYSDVTITDKSIYNSRILGNANATEGSIRTTTTGYFQIYLNGVWNTVVINFVLRENATNSYVFEHQPIGFTEWIEIMSGNGRTLGLNGLPLVSQYQASMGAYGVPLQLDCGVF